MTKEDVGDICVITFISVLILGLISGTLYLAQLTDLREQRKETPACVIHFKPSNYECVSYDVRDGECLVIKRKDK